MKLADRIQTALDEARILVLGVQVLLGFAYQSFFQDGFESLDPASRRVQTTALPLLIVSLCLVLAPAARHRIVEHGSDCPAFDAFTRRACELALWPFAVAIALSLYVVGAKVGGSTIAITMGLTGGTVAGGLWYAVPFAMRRREAKSTNEDDEMKQKADLDQEIRQALTETRVVLPGTQALLGFQLATMFQKSFDALPHEARLVHAASLGGMALSAMLLMFPAAYHRIAEHGDDSQRVEKVVSSSLLGAMALLAAGMSGDVFVVSEKLGSDARTAALAAISVLAIALLAWFAVPLAIRARQSKNRFVADSPS